jgi:uncharacterized protein (TIGR02246 family)
METRPVEKELMELERRYWQAIKDKDVEAAMALSDESCMVTGAQGVGRIDRQAMGQMLKAAKYTLTAFDVRGDMQVRMLGDDVAIVAYLIHEDLIVDGQPVSLDAADSSTWVRRDGRWLCALHTEALAGDPFGRDRLANSQNPDRAAAS